MCGRDKERTTLYVMVFCVGDDPPGIPRERGLYSTQHKHSQRSTGESTSQSVPGLKAKVSPPPITTTILTHTQRHIRTQGHGHACTYAQRHIEECFHIHTHMHRVGLFLLHTLNCPQCPPSVYSRRPQC